MINRSILEMLENSEELPRAHVNVFKLLVLFDLKSKIQRDSV